MCVIPEAAEGGYPESIVRKRDWIPGSPLRGAPE
jgi:hypothetical protein